MGEGVKVWGLGDGERQQRECDGTFAAILNSLNLQEFLFDRTRNPPRSAPTSTIHIHISYFDFSRYILYYPKKIMVALLFSLCSRIFILL